MRFTRARTAATWLLFAAIGCGSGAGGCGGCGGCEGCGGGTEAIPGGFDPALRASNAVVAELSPRAFDFLEEQVGVLVADQAGGSLSQGVPCTHSVQTIDNPIRFLPDINVDIFACDLDNNDQCTAADEDPALRADVPGHGRTCELAVAIDGVTVTPLQNTNGTVDVTIQVNIRVNTGRIPLRVSQSSIGDVECYVEFDSDRNAPPTIPIKAVLRLSIDPATGDVLGFDLAQFDDLADAIDSNELTIEAAGSGSTDRFVCNALGSDLLKEQLFGQLSGPIEDEIRAQIDAVRCRACEETTNACPGASTCDEGTCWYDRAAGRCPPPLLGMESRNRIAMPGFDALLDLSILAGGKNADGKPSHHAQGGALTLGLLGGSRAPEPAACVPHHRWAPRPVTPQPDFLAESAIPATDGTSLADYALGLAVSDDFLDRLFHDAYHAGLICQDVDGATTGFLSTGLFTAFLPSLSQLTQGEDRPMLLSVRPRRPPSVVIGKGTVKPGPNGTPVPDDALLTIEMQELQIDFYALLEDRQVRLFSLTGDVRVPLSLEFDATANTVLPVIGDLSGLFANVVASNSDVLAEDPAALGQLLGSLISLAQGPLAEALQPIELPTETNGISVAIRDARGVLPRQNGDGHAHLAMFASLETAPPSPLVARVDTSATLLDFHVPTLAGIRANERVSATVLASAVTQVRRTVHVEYSARVDRGLWSPWQRSARITLAADQFAIQGTHAIEVRARHAGAPSTTDVTPARIELPVDYEAPRVRLERVAGTLEVGTVAFDPGTPAERLSFRYRTANADWTGPGAARTFALDTLGSPPFLEVEVTDLAGHVTTSRFGAIDPEVPVPDVEAAGCASSPSSLLVLLVLAIRRRRST